MPLTKATTNVINLDKDTTINGLTVGKGAGNISTNTTLGLNALLLNTTGIQNTAVGVNALSANTFGDSNTALGKDALLLNSTGIQNTAVGVNALDNNTTGSYNTSVGVNSLTANTTGSNNTGLGKDALLLNTIGIQNTAVGAFALKANTFGDNNTAVGRQALESNTTGFSNTAVGVNALDSNTFGESNTAVGVNALQSNDVGAYNVAVGLQALNANVIGSSNTAVGHLAGSACTGDENVFIGKSAAGSTTSISNQVNIYNGSAIARFTGAAVAWGFISDQRDKKNIEDLTIGLDFINQLKARKFAWEMRNSDVDKGKEASGFISQEVLQVVNDNNAAYTGLVDTSNPEQYTLAATNLIPILVKAVQELSAKVAELEAK